MSSIKSATGDFIIDHGVNSNEKNDKIELIP